jgi:ATP-dependent Clp protease ATP-binding subunit ClpA
MSKQKHSPLEQLLRDYVSQHKQQLFERFTNNARKAMALANQEAQKHNHEYIAPEHILLGFLKLDMGVGIDVLKKLGRDIQEIRIALEKAIKSGPDMITLGKLPHTEAAKKVVAEAVEAARGFKHDYVGTEHLLIALLAVPETIASTVLTEQGLTHLSVRDKVTEILGQTPGPNPNVHPLPLVGETMGQFDNPIRQPEDGDAPKVIDDLSPQERAELFGSFSPDGHWIIEYGDREARRRKHEYFGTEHLLYGIVALKDGIGRDVLAKLGVTAERLSNAITKLVKDGVEDTSKRLLPFTANARQVFDVAKKEAKNLNLPEIGSEHILLGIIQVPDCVAAHALTDELKLNLEEIRKGVLDRLDYAIAHRPAEFVTSMTVEGTDDSTERSSIVEQPNKPKIRRLVVISHFADNSDNRHVLVTREGQTRKLMEIHRDILMIESGVKERKPGSLAFDCPLILVITESDGFIAPYLRRPGSQSEVDEVLGVKSPKANSSPT